MTNRRNRPSQRQSTKSRYTRVGLGFQSLEARRLLAGGPRLALLINGFEGADTPDRVEQYLINAGFDGIGTNTAAPNSTGNLISNWNELVPDSSSNPGRLFAGTVSSQEFGFRTDAVTVGGTEIVPSFGESIKIPTGFDLGIVDLGSPDNSGDVIRDAVNILNRPEYSEPDAQVVIIGHSLGGDTALKIAQATNTNIDLLALLDPVGFSGVAGTVSSIANQAAATIPGFGEIAPGINVNIPVNSVNETPGFFATTNLSNSSVPSNVGYFYNRWQTNAPFPVSYIEQNREISCNASVCDQGPQNTVPDDERYFPRVLDNGNFSPEVFAFLAPQRFDFNPFGSRTVNFLGRDIRVPAENDNFGLTNAQLHHDFPNNTSVQNDLLRILRGIDPRSRPDRFEENDNITTATILPSNDFVALDTLTVDSSNDVDFYKFTASKTGLVQASIEFCETDGSLSFDIVDSAGNVIEPSTASGTRDARTLTITLAATPGQEFFLRVDGVGSSFNEYELNISTLAIEPPNYVELAFDSDTGLSINDHVTRDGTPQTIIQSDLRQAGNAGLLGSQSANRVEVIQLVTDVSSGFLVSQTTATQAGGLSNYVFETTTLPLLDGEYLFSAFVRLTTASGLVVETALSPPTKVFVDQTPPPNPPAPVLQSSSDSGVIRNDRVTNQSSLSLVGSDGDGGELVTIIANGSIVGQSHVVPGGGYQVETDVLTDDVYEIQVVLTDIAGNFSNPSEILVVEVDTLAPKLPFLDLVEEDDSGRHNDDNVTSVLTPDFTATTEDPNELFHLLPDNLIYRIYQRDEGGAETEIFNSGLVAPGADPLTANDLELTANEINNLKLEVEDRAGNISPDFLLSVLVDTTAPDAPSLGLDPAVTDTGVATDLTTLSDRITRSETPGFVGTAEADALVRLYADAATVTDGVINGSDSPIGIAMADPGNGDDAFPGGQYRAISTSNLNVGFGRDGQRQIGATAEDLAGNVSEPVFLDILLDTNPPRIDGVDFADGTTVFASKPDLTPSPATDSLLITFIGGPSAAAGLTAPAVDLGMAADVRNYQIVGDHGGNVLINNAVIMSQSPEEVVVRIQFDGFLADDRYTLTLDDSISDAAGNVLDGDSSAQAPGTPVILFPSGNGTPGGDFVARFTVDSRPEFGVISQGLIYVDINGNHVFDPEGQDNDATNRDFVMQFGGIADAHFAGNFADQATGVASGFDKLGSYGRFNGTYSFLLDTNDDGVGDFSSVMPAGYQVSGIPVAGNFNAANDGDEIGLFDGQAWYLDNNGNNRIDAGERIAANYNGIPIVGDFNGDGNDDLAVYVNDTNQFIFDTNRDGRADHTWDAKDDVERFAGLSGFTDKPVVGDINLDGVDDIGLWVKGRQGVLPKESGEFFFWVSDRVSNNPANVFDAYSPAPLGNDTFALFGDETALPIFGNFDPPVAGASASSNAPTLTNPNDSYDVNNDGNVTALDALTVINALNRGQTEAKASQAARMFATMGSYLDVNGSEDITALDALMVINQLNRQAPSGIAEGESVRSDSSSSDYASGVDAVLSDGLDDDEEDDLLWLLEDSRRLAGVN